MTVSPDRPPQRARVPGARYPELERLIGNAVCDAQFAALLLADPATAISDGSYRSRLSLLEQETIESLQGFKSLADFAARLHQQLATTDDAMSDDQPDTHEIG